MTNRNVEKERYDKRAKLILEKGKFSNITPAYLNEISYKYYFRILEKIKDGRVKLLEIGGGMGENTMQLINLKYNVTSIDISPKSIEVMEKKFHKHKNFHSEIADMEKLPFENETFDVVCSAGCLSYGDNTVVMNEIYRVLKNDGIMIVIDSLNNNPIYRLNRYIRYLRGDRSKSTLKRMPTLDLINKYNEKFGYSEIRYFASITWLIPFLNKILSKDSVIKLSNWVDLTFNINKSAFKFVMLAVKK